MTSNSNEFFKIIIFKSYKLEALVDILTFSSQQLQGKLFLGIFS